LASHRFSSRNAQTKSKAPFSAGRLRRPCL
jgi:hypothetical protein